MSDEVDRILLGIDITEVESIYGWWETSTGAEFGAKKLAEIKELIEPLYTPKQVVNMMEAKCISFVRGGHPLELSVDEVLKLLK